MKAAAALEAVDALLAAGEVAGARAIIARWRESDTARRLERNEYKRKWREERDSRDSRVRRATVATVAPPSPPDGPPSPPAPPHPPLKPPPSPAMSVTQQQVDGVIERWNGIIGSKMKPGSKGTSEAIRKCIRRIAPEHGGTKEAALHLLACVKWKAEGMKADEDPKWLLPQTVCRPANLARIEEQMALPSKRNGAPTWNPRL